MLKGQERRKYIRMRRPLSKDKGTALGPTRTKGGGVLKNHITETENRS